MILILSASPNPDGLTAACTTAALAGCAAAGEEAVHLDLCKLKLEHCRQCENGWGRCRREHACIIPDGIVAVQQALRAARALVLITPVYYGDLSESAKTVFDRLRRCESTRGEESGLAGKPLLAVAAAGGGGGGVTSCLTQMERYTQHLRGQVADLIGVTRRNRAYTLEHIRQAATALAAAVTVEA